MTVPEIAVWIGLVVGIVLRLVMLAGLCYLGYLSITYLLQVTG